MISLFGALALAVSAVTAKECTNVTVPVTISARTGVFNVLIPQTILDAATFTANLTQQGHNFSKTALTGYATTSGTYDISAQFCTPSKPGGNSPTVQILTHGIGFDKTYWDASYNNFNYSYVDVATDKYGYSTLAYDRLGIGNSSHGDPLNEIQAPLEVAALVELTELLRAGTFPGVPTAFKKAVHIGHSFGSVQSYALADAYPDLSDAIVLTGFSLNSTFMPTFITGGNFVPASFNQPFRFGNLTFPEEKNPRTWGVMSTKALKDPAVAPFIEIYGLTDLFTNIFSSATPLNYPPGYLTNSDVAANQLLFFQPGNFDPNLLYLGETTKQPVALGELLSIGGGSMTNKFAGPVLIITGETDVPFCGGDCLATGDPKVPSIPAAARKAFPNVKDADFEAYIQPNTGHGLTFHYNATAGYDVINEFVNSKGLASS